MYDDALCVSSRIMKEATQRKLYTCARTRARYESGAHRWGFVEGGANKRSVHTPSTAPTPRREAGHIDATRERTHPSAREVCSSDSRPMSCSPKPRSSAWLSRSTGRSACACRRASAEEALCSSRRGSKGCAASSAAVPPRKKRTSLRMEVTTFSSCAVSGGASARTAGGSCAPRAPMVKSSSFTASRESASAAATTSSNRKPRKASPSGAKKKRSASLALLACRSASRCGLSRVTSPASASLAAGGRATEALGCATSARVPARVPALPRSVPPRTPSTLKAVPSPVSLIATNFSRACSRSIMRSTSNCSDLPYTMYRSAALRRGDSSVSSRFEM
mmetsp:Transcript_38360/g.87895  ORF Transcript_38360/g.87895 Transcript_38360/m.87895 type:complete len:335 (-) Transcript_38360:936-1940(-)